MQVRIASEMNEAASTNDVTRMRSWLLAGALPKSSDYSGRTPLQMAVRHSAIDVIDILLEFGADPALRDEFGLSAIDEAQTIGDDELFRQLIAVEEADNLLDDSDSDEDNSGSEADSESESD